MAVFGLWLFTFLGTEFLPQLNEGSIYVRATLPQSIALDESVELANTMRRKLMAYPEVRQVMSQTGRPNDGTDATGFYNIEFHVDIYPEKEWESKLTKLELIDKMQQDLSIYPGIDFNFSQPISDNVEEAASGVKGSIAVKVFGKDLYESQKLAVQIDKILGTVEGIEDLGVIRNIGQPELRIELDEQKLARYGVAKEDVQSIIEMAIGGIPSERRSDRQDIGSGQRWSHDTCQGIGGYPYHYRTLTYFQGQPHSFLCGQILRAGTGHGNGGGRGTKESKCRDPSS